MPEIATGVIIAPKPWYTPKTVQVNTGLLALFTLTPPPFLPRRPATWFPGPAAAGGGPVWARTVRAANVAGTSWCGSSVVVSVASTVSSSSLLSACRWDSCSVFNCLPFNSSIQVPHLWALRHRPFTGGDGASQGGTSLGKPIAG